MAYNILYNCGSIAAHVTNTGSTGSPMVAASRRTVKFGHQETCDEHVEEEGGVAAAAVGGQCEASLISLMDKTLCVQMWL